MHINPKFYKILNIFEQISRIISITLLFYIFISHIAQSLISSKINFDERIFNVPYLKFITILAIATGLAGIILAHFQGKKGIITFTSLYTREKIALSLSAFFFSIFFTGDTVPLFSKVLIVCETGILMFLLPRLVGFYTTTKIKHIIDKNMVPTLTYRSMFMIGIAILVISLSGFVFFNIVSAYLTGQVNRDQEAKSRLYIKSVNPTITAHAEIVEITGYNFGWKTNDQYKLMNDLGAIPVSEWTNEKIRFDVPLHLKEGKNNIWIQKPTEKDPGKILETNKVQINIISRFALYPSVEDPKWKKAIKKINRTLFFRFRFLYEFIY